MLKVCVNSINELLLFAPFRLLTNYTIESIFINLFTIVDGEWVEDKKGFDL